MRQPFQEASPSSARRGGSASAPREEAPANAHDPAPDEAADPIPLGRQFRRVLSKDEADELSALTTEREIRRLARRQEFIDWLVANQVRANAMPSSLICCRFRLMWKSAILQASLHRVEHE